MSAARARGASARVAAVVAAQSEVKRSSVGIVPSVSVGEIVSAAAVAASAVDAAAEAVAAVVAAAVAAALAAATAEPSASRTGLHTAATSGLPGAKDGGSGAMTQWSGPRLPVRGAAETERVGTVGAEGAGAEGAEGAGAERVDEEETGCDSCRGKARTAMDL